MDNKTWIPRTGEPVEVKPAISGDWMQGTFIELVGREYRVKVNGCTGLWVHCRPSQDVAEKAVALLREVIEAEEIDNELIDRLDSFVNEYELDKFIARDNDR